LKKNKEEKTWFAWLVLLIKELVYSNHPHSLSKYAYSKIFSLKNLADNLVFFIYLFLMPELL
jgi:hypothetical protein